MTVMITREIVAEIIISIVRRAVGSDFCQELDRTRQDFQVRWDSWTDEERVNWITGGVENV